VNTRIPDETDYISYSPLVDRPTITWPNGARVALWIVPNIALYEYLPPRSEYIDQWPRTPHPDVLNYSYRDYGNRVGFWRMLEVFDQYQIRATASLNVGVVEHFPQIRKAMVDRDWEMMSHGAFNTDFLFGLSIDEERAFYRDTTETVRRLTGQTMKGMLGPSFTATEYTPELMAEAGLIYHADWFIDDQPFPIKVSKPPLVGIPYTRQLNDHFMFSFNDPAWEGEYFVQVCKDQFDALYAEGEHSGMVMCLALHPFLIGTPHRIRYLDEVFAYLCGRDDVWYASGAEIAEWYISHHSEEASK
jgi:peptidoglycan/xylan/chitin deacetylase (PgdA/CDA1 family)